VSDERPTPGRTTALLGDLESIRSLLEEAEAGEQPEISDEEVPLLEDVVEGGVSVDEAFLSGEAFPSVATGLDAPATESSRFDDTIFKALLSDEWRDVARAALVGAERDPAGDPAGNPAGNPAGELDEVIVARIDAALQRWLRQAVLNGIDDLRRELLAAVRDQLGESIAAQSEEDEDLDGA
jgi:hypothetical protein